jgi:hypothetical protein
VLLTRLIVSSYAGLLEDALWLALALAAVAGFNFAVPLLHLAGAIPAFELTWRIIGSLASVVVVFFGLAVFVGPILTLIDIRNAVRSIESRLDRPEDGRALPPSERRDPAL